MHEVMEKTFLLIDVLEESDIIRELDIYKREIENNSELRELINKGNNTKDQYEFMDIKNKLYKYPEYKGYIQQYNELMYLVMEINARYKKLIGMGSCFR